METQPPGFREFLRAMWPRTREQATGGIVAVILFVCALVGYTLSPWVGSVFLVATIALASYGAWVFERKTLGALTVEFKQHQDKQASETAAQRTVTVQRIKWTRAALSHVRWERDRLDHELKDALARLADRSEAIETEKAKATEIKLNRERERAKDAAEKERARRENLVVYAKSVDERKHPLHALMLAKAHELPTNDDLLAFINDIVAAGHVHPFRSDYLTPDVPPESGFLEYLHDARSKGCEFKTDEEIFSYSTKTRNQNLDKYFGGRSKQTPS